MTPICGKIVATLHFSEHPVQI